MSRRSQTSRHSRSPPSRSRRHDGVNEGSGRRRSAFSTSSASRRRERASSGSSVEVLDTTLSSRRKVSSRGGQSGGGVEPPALSAALRERFARIEQAEIIVGSRIVSINNEAWLQAVAPADWLTTDDVPLLDVYAENSQSLAARAAKFFADVLVNDKLAAQVRSASAIMIEVELLCTLSRFCRLLEPLKLGRFKVQHDRSIYAYRTGDLVGVVVTALDDPLQRLLLQLSTEQATLSAAQLPLYYRIAVRRQHARNAEGAEATTPQPPSTPVQQQRFDEDRDLARLAHNPTAAYAYGFARRCGETLVPSMFACRPLRPVDETAESLRAEQQARVAEAQIRRAADYMRSQQPFEAIQCCNQALKLLPQNADALLARAIAANNMENFASAVLDLDRILEVEPSHTRARAIIDRVLVQQAEKHEETAEWHEALAAFDRALTFAPSNATAIAGRQRVQKRLPAASHANGAPPASAPIVVIDLEDDDVVQIDAPKAAGGGRSNATRVSTIAADEDPEARKRRLYEYEIYKQTLAKRVRQ